MSASLDSDDTELQEIRAGLTGCAEDLCRALLGEPTSRTSRELRYGRRGSFSLVLSGAKRGLWHDHESNTGGDLLALIRRERGGSFAEAVQYARHFLSMPEQERPKAAPRQQRQAGPSDDEALRIRRAQAFALAGEDLIGTVAEQYLVATRDIPKPAAGWPAAVRFHRQRNALMLVATDAEGGVRAVQLVHLTDHAQKRPDEPGKPTKQSFGVLEGAAVRLPKATQIAHPHPSALLLAEGPETGLSVWASTGRPTWIALGSVAKVQPPALTPLVVCADDDPRDAPAAKALGKAVSRWRSEGRDVAVATPWSPRRFNKSDFNDLIRKDGPAAILARIATALSPRGPQPPGNAALPVELARVRLQQAIERFFTEARDFDPDGALLDGVSRLPIVHAARVAVGLGKSDSARREAAKLLARMRARGDRRNVVFAVPTHALGEEQARRFEALPEARSAGLRAAVWRGREADDPLQPGDKMCHDLEAVREAQSVGAKPEAAVCRNKHKSGSPACPFFEVCGYQRQKGQEADLWFVPHELLFANKPATLGKVAVLVVDEAAWRKGLEGVDGPPIDMTLDTLAEDIPAHEKLSSLNAARIRSIHHLVLKALGQHQDGPLRRDVLLREGLTHDTGRDGYALSWERVIEADIHPGMPAEDRRAAVRAVQQNRAAMRCARFFTALKALLADDGPEASGWASLVTVEGENGPVRMLRLRSRRSVAKAWLVPTLHLDATLNADLLRPYWPNVEVTAEIEARTPHMRVRQLHGRDWPKTALVPDDYCDQAEAERRLKNSERLRSAVWREARQAHGRVLVVAQKAVEDYWKQAGPVPANVEMAHHNNVAGRDEWGPQPNSPGVSLTVVVGRTQPRPGDVERIAEALTGKAVTVRCSRYDRQDSAIQLADGASISAPADRHPDPIAEAVRWQICEGELLQIIGRPRGANRTAANPVEVLVLTDRPLPIPVDEAVTWDELMPSPADLMLGQGGVALESSGDAARVYPNLWPSQQAAKKAFQRGKWGTNPNREYSIGECPPLLRRATYCRTGQGARPATLIFDPEAVPDLRDWLEERLGPLASLEIQPAPPEPPLGPRPAAGSENSQEQRTHSSADSDVGKPGNRRAEPSPEEPRDGFGTNGPFAPKGGQTPRRAAKPPPDQPSPDHSTQEIRP